MNAININDAIVEITHIDQWKNNSAFKSELFAYDFYKSVIATDESSFIISSKLRVSQSLRYSPDDVIISKFTCADESNKRVFFNLTPHLKEFSNLYVEQLNDIKSKKSSVDYVDDELIQSIHAMKSAFLILFDNIHKKIAA